MAEYRLNKYISIRGIAPRRVADRLIQKGKVKVNGNVIKEPWFKVKDGDIVEVRHKKLEVGKEKFLYIAFYKPKGYISERKLRFKESMYHLLPKELRGLNHAGRLDQDSEGLIILTNDGYLIYQLTHPSQHITKKYYVVAIGKKIPEDLEKKLTEGIKLKEGIAKAKYVKILEKSNRKVKLIIHLSQGIRRQIRRMLGILGLVVVKLKRFAIGPIKLGDLKPGEFRNISKEELEELKLTYESNNSSSGDR